MSKVVVTVQMIPWWAVRIPTDLVLDHALLPGARHLFMILADLSADQTGDQSADQSAADRSPPLQPALSGLMQRCGINDRKTIRRHLVSLSNKGWLSIDPRGHRLGYYLHHQAPTVSVPGAMIHDRRLRAGAKCLYASLLAIQAYSGGKIVALRPQLQTAVGIGSNHTLEQYIVQLVKAGWLSVQFVSKTRGSAFLPLDPHLSTRHTARQRVRLRLIGAEFRGETLMKEMLSIIADDTDFLDNARPGRLANPLTGAPLELDRFYQTANVAFEFNGPQHYGVTELFPDATKVQQQQVRDRVKDSLARELGITLVTVEPHELTFARLREKVDGLLPLRTVRYSDPVVRLLERRSREYIRNQQRQTWANM